MAKSLLPVAALLALAVFPSTAVAADPYLADAGVAPCPTDYAEQRRSDPDHLLLCEVIAYSNAGIRDRAMADRLLEALFLAEENGSPLRALLALKTADVLAELGDGAVALQLLARHVPADVPRTLHNRARMVRMAVALRSAAAPDALARFEALIVEMERDTIATPLARETVMRGWSLTGYAYRAIGDDDAALAAFERLTKVALEPAGYQRSYFLESWRELARIAHEAGEHDRALALIETAAKAVRDDGYLVDGDGVVLLRTQIQLARGELSADLFPGELLGDPELEFRPRADNDLMIDARPQAEREQVLSLFRRIHKERGGSDFMRRPAMPDVPQLPAMAFEQAQSLSVSKADASASFANALRQLSSEEERVRLEMFDRAKDRFRQNLRRYAAAGTHSDPAILSAIKAALRQDRAAIAAVPDFAGEYKDTPGEPPIYRSIHPWYLGGFRQWYAPGQVEDMILIVPADGDIHVFVLGWPEETPYAWHVVEGGVARIAPLVERLRCQVDKKSCTDDAGFDLARMPISRLEMAGQLPYDRAAAYDLYRLLIEPVSPAMTPGSDVLVMASGAMATLPLAMLVTEPPQEGYDWADYTTMRTAPWLGKRHAFTTVPSFDSFRPNRFFPISNVSRDMLFAVADPAFDGQVRPGELRSADFVTLTREGRLANLDAIRKLEPLPGTKAEYETMRDSLGVGEEVALMGSRASEARLRQHPDLGKARYLLLATHGLLPGENDAGLIEPALVLTPPDVATEDNDGLLTASEVRALSLRAEWVFLSACNTASAGGTGDSLSALASAFLKAGALQVLASHWSVLDDVTPVLTTATIRAAARDPKGGPGRALQSASVAVREGRWSNGEPVEGWKQFWAHPIAWAPFVLVSNGDEAIINERFDLDLE